MSDIQDKTNCIKNLIQTMCCDGNIADAEKRFLFAAAKKMELKVDRWDELLKEVTADQGAVYPIQDRNRAVAALKAMIVMAKADQHVDENEKACLRRFAKSIGLSNHEWKQILKEIDLRHLFDPFQAIPLSGSILVLKDDFDKLDTFLQVTQENKIKTRTVEHNIFLQSPPLQEDVVFFHASPDRELTVEKGKQVLEKSAGKAVSILHRHQGYQVRYLMEIGLKKCIIQPVYARDLEKVLQPE